jgi:ribonuclease-3
MNDNESSKKLSDTVISDSGQIIERLAECIGYKFKNSELPMEALVHRSYFNEHPNDFGNNERLEFLGDAVLDLVMAQVLMERMPLSPEGELTQCRSALVNEESLAAIARNLNLGELIFLGKGEQKNNGRDKPSILSDVVEAIIGAVFMDSDFNMCRDVILSWFEPMLSDVVLGHRTGDTKTMLQENLQKKGFSAPSYAVVASTGPDHDKTFEVQIVLNGKTLASGVGKSKKEAEKQAAQNALDVMNEGE